MMEHTDSLGCAPLCVQAIRMGPNATVMVRQSGLHPLVCAEVSARIDEQVVRACVAARCNALMVVTQSGIAVVVDFIANARSRQQTAQASRTLRCDTLELGNGACLYVKGRTLHMRAHHMELRAEGEQRLMAATVHVG